MKMPKILVEIVLPNGDSLKKSCKIEDDRVVVDAGAKGRGHEGWKPSFTRYSVVNERKGRIFKSHKRKVIVRLGAERCLEFHTDKDDMPSVTRGDIKRLFDAQVLKNAGRSVLQVKIPWYFTLLMFLIFLFSVLNLLNSTGVSIGR